MDRSKTITIIGCGGFIGSHLLERILSESTYDVFGIDIASAKISHLLENPRLSYVNLNVNDYESVRSYMEQSGIVILLAALCNPSLYNTIPVEVIDADFTKPLEIVRLCSELKCRLIHFSTCEVYGKTIAALCRDPSKETDPRYYLLKEDETPLISGPVGAQRWSYACAKELLERAIVGYSFEKGLDFTIIRPFNFIGPKMDFIPGIDGTGIPRAPACFMENLLSHKPLKLVDGGKNRRCFTFIDDAVDAICAILKSPQRSNHQIFNIGNPDNEITIEDLAKEMIHIYKSLRPDKSGLVYDIENVSAMDFYGEGYEDSDRRVPDISKISGLLGWRPKTDLRRALLITIEAYIKEYAGKDGNS